MNHKEMNGKARTYGWVGWVGGGRVVFAFSFVLFSWGAKAAEEMGSDVFPCKSHTACPTPSRRPFPPFLNPSNDYYFPFPFFFSSLPALLFHTGAPVFTIWVGRCFLHILCCLCLVLLVLLPFASSCAFSLCLSVPRPFTRE